MLDRVKIVLVNPSHPGNIGAAARAMKAMGLSRLTLVNPVRFPHHTAIVRAAGADDLLQCAQVEASLADAVADCHYVVGTSAQQRTLPWPLLTPRTFASETSVRLSASPSLQVALVFGRERSGLDNEELALCQHLVQIPTVADFSSLNLAAAVQVLCYELSLAVPHGVNSQESMPLEQAATAAEMEGLYGHLQSTMAALGFLNPAQPRMLMQRLRHLFNRARMSRTEVNILRGLLRAVNWTAQNRSPR